MQIYDGLVFAAAIILVCLYVTLGVLANSNAFKFTSPAIVAVLMACYSLLPMQAVN